MLKNLISSLCLFVLLPLTSGANSVSDEILTKLSSLNGVTVKETTNSDDLKMGMHRFAIQIDQAVDHFGGKAGSFKQKLVLFHRGFDEPMVLQTSGYSIFGEKLSRIAFTFQTNQIQVEHRHFSTSVPNPMDWSKLDIKQSAEDFHHIVEIFKQVYYGRWVGTGASKGGMTSIFHRRFFPQDLDGTVADVAPISFALEDKRYIDFVDKVGGEKYSQCRVNLEIVQKLILLHKKEIVPMMKGEFIQLGSAEVALEHAVTEMPFIFWQYGNPVSGKANCYNIPSAGASADDLFEFLQKANKISDYADDTLKMFQPYYYQAANELGAPALKRNHLTEVLKFPMTISMYLPKGEKYSYSDTPMKDVAEWVASHGDGLMFVYGEFDPWSAGAYQNPGKGDNHYFVVPGGNHGSNFTLLSGDAKDEAFRVLSNWLKKAPPQNMLPESYQTIEDLEFSLKL